MIKLGMTNSDEMFLGGTTVFDHEFPNSTSIRKIAYNKVTQNLIVEFRNPQLKYEYKAIPEEVVTELISATSAGRFLSDNIKKAGYSYRVLS